LKGGGRKIAALFSAWDYALDLKNFDLARATTLRFFPCWLPPQHRLPMTDGSPRTPTAARLD
jgi:hypothetical protein